MSERSIATSALAILLGCISITALAQPSTVLAPLPPRTYADVCATCHDRNGFAVQMLTARLGADRALLHRGTRLSPAAIKAIVRNGTGAMPAMSRIEVSDAELADIATWLASQRSPSAAR